MKLLPDTKNSPVLRTDFSDDAAWRSVCAAIEEPVGEFKAYVHFISDAEYDGLRTEQLPSLVPQGWNHSFLFIVDQMTLAHPEHPILVVNMYPAPGRTFRVIPSEMWGVENNLSIANMDFDEFADSVDSDGIFRGFPDA